MCPAGRGGLHLQPRRQHEQHLHQQQQQHCRLHAASFTAASTQPCSRSSVWSAALVAVAIVILLPGSLARMLSEATGSGSNNGGGAHPLNPPYDCATLHPAIVAAVAKELAPWKKLGGISAAVMRNASKLCEQPNDPGGCGDKYMRMSISDGELYLNSLSRRRSELQFTAEMSGFILEIWELTQRYKIPNVDIIFQPSDGAEGCSVQAGTKREDGIYQWQGRICELGNIPMINFARGEDQLIILAPYAGAFRCQGHNFDELVAKQSQISQVPWEQRKRMAFGRWNPFCAYWQNAPNANYTNGEHVVCGREYLPTLCKEHPDILDIHTIGSGGFVPFDKQNEFRYLVSTDGWTASSKFERYLLLGSVVLKQDSKRAVYFEDAVKPYEHYVPILKDNKTDILQVIEWLNVHDKEAMKIAEQAQTFALTHLNRAARMCYWKLLFEEYSKLFRYTPSKADHAMNIPALEELKFLAQHDIHHACPYRKQIEEVLGHSIAEPGSDRVHAAPDHMYMHGQPAGQYWPSDFGQPLAADIR